MLELPVWQSSWIYLGPMLNVVSVLQWMKRKWVCVCVQQRVGVQQGASHSPALFSYCVADSYDVLTGLCEANGEQAPFVTINSTLWGLWFVDDATAFFATPLQHRRLMPRMLQNLGGLGLKLKVQKTCVLSLSVPGCVPEFEVGAGGDVCGNQVEAVC